MRLTNVAALPEPLAQLVELSHRLGSDQSLVLHGGGNASAKGTTADRGGRTRNLMWVKASGADLAKATVADFTAVWLDELVPLRGRATMSDDEVDACLQAARTDPRSPLPSVETLLHAFLPFGHVEHVHADAILALANHPRGGDATREALGSGFAYLDWSPPGLTLAKAVAELSDFDGVVLAHHGLVTWADNPIVCLDKTRDAVARASAYLATRRRKTRPRRLPDLLEGDLQRLLLRVRAEISEFGRRVVFSDRDLRELADRSDVDAVVAAGVSSADHMLWMKPFAALVDDCDAAAVREAIAGYRRAYSAYYDRNRNRISEVASMHDPTPRMILVPGLGGLATGHDREEARRVDEVAGHSLRTAARAIDAFGECEPLTESATFDFDYWPLELRKLARRPAPRPFSGTIHIVTGAASGIGRRIALEIARRGGSVVAADLDRDGLQGLASDIAVEGGPEPVAVVGDQSDEGVVEETVRQAVLCFGGIDGVVMNAGIGVGGNLDELRLDQWRVALGVNLTSAFLLTRAALRVLKEQGLGGSLVYVASKNAFAPGAGFGAYSVTKAGMLQLMRIAALEGGGFGIRANGVNPDAVFDDSRLWAGGLREERAAAHGVRPEELEDFYAKRNLLHRHVTTHNVAASVMFLLSEESSRTTGCVIPVDGGVAAAFPR